MRALGRINTWAEGYWREISWPIFWASVAEAEELARRAKPAEEKRDPLPSHERRLARYGVPTPYSPN